MQANVRSESDEPSQSRDEMAFHEKEVLPPSCG